MTSEIDPIKVEHKYVLVFDICSSTTIVEDLIRSERQELWRSLLIIMKNHLVEERAKSNFIIYKFIGDGWILLFEEHFSMTELFLIMKRICEKYDDAFRRKIKGVLSIPIDAVGITFGLEEGSLIKIVMNSQTEYVGRAINIATRLQGAIKDKDKNPQGKVMMSNKVYVDAKHEIKSIYRVVGVERNLRNISGGNKYLAKKLYLFEAPKKKA
ncbi:MAG TPA: hypothetical protein DCZ94_21050 [Lentisphaeria bacterium]|nr:MAG: hypothetical protein A2X48_23255 [Lentisphaerae bacterium GWF2_49_21]HBC89433.1 hypothetical protein [Lentisphaeria bacterium]